MDPYDPILDQPEVVEFDEAPDAVRIRLANHDLYFEADANSDLYDLHWPWADERYVRSIHMHIHDPIGEELMTLVTRYYAGYQETILGNEGMIISKRITAPLGSHYDRSVLWNLECQAEGDRLVRLDIEIDWGEPLTQRIVDGLLVAQDNPRRAQGIYKQRNADRTLVFGNPQGRPSAYEFDDAGRASLTYYILVNGIVEVPLLLTISDVGEQVAWSGFLALRDAEREFELSNKQWEEAMKTGRLWTSDPRLNRAVQQGRIECLKHTQRMRTGLAPTSRTTTEIPALVDCFDAFNVTESRNLLAHLRRLVEKGEGRLADTVPIRPKDAVADPGDDLVHTNSAYLRALHAHLRRHPDVELLRKHMHAVALSADELVRLGWQDEAATQGDHSARIADALETAAELAVAASDGANAARWSSEAAERRKDATSADETTVSAVDEWLVQSGWRCTEGSPCSFASAQAGIDLAAQTVWRVTGLEWRDDGLWVYPRRVPELSWWALVDFPIEDRSARLVWDGQTLHTTVRVHSDHPVHVCERIDILNTDEDDFALQFDIVNAGEEEEVRPDEVRRFRPEFDRDAGE